MGRHIRRTITITLTETWTFVWAQADDAPAYTITVVQVNPTPKEEHDEPLQVPISRIDLANPTVDEPPAPPLTPDPALESQPGDAATKATPHRKRKRSQGRRTTGKP
jgi:hypothetical protein